jgi:hypothetical protein
MLPSCTPVRAACWRTRCHVLYSVRGKHLVKLPCLSDSTTPRCCPTMLDTYVSRVHGPYGCRYMLVLIPPDGFMQAHSEGSHASRPAPRSCLAAFPKVAPFKAGHISANPGTDRNSGPKQAAHHTMMHTRRAVRGCSARVRAQAPSCTQGRHACMRPQNDAVVAMRASRAGARPPRQNAAAIERATGRWRGDRGAFQARWAQRALQLRCQLEPPYVRGVNVAAAAAPRVADGRCRNAPQATTPEMQPTCDATCDATRRARQQARHPVAMKGRYTTCTTTLSLIRLTASEQQQQRHQKPPPRIHACWRQRHNPAMAAAVTAPLCSPVSMPPAHLPALVSPTLQIKPPH